MERKIYVWSTPLKPIRKFAVPFNIQRRIVEVIPWTERLFKLPVHTFTTIDEEWHDPPVKNVKEGYWYCAGDFCSTSERTVVGVGLEDTNLEFAKCLVKPDIKKGELTHNMEVIGGAYIVDYVCHNITNRVLFSSKKLITLANARIPLTGYKAVVMSPLGLYGRQTREWSLVIDKCRNIFINEIDIDHGPRSKDAEIDIIHRNAANGNHEVGENITNALLEVDAEFTESSFDVYNSFDSKRIGVEDLNNKMGHLLRMVITNTERVVGPNISKRIYGDYTLDEESSDKSGSDSNDNGPPGSKAKQMYGSS